jgi:uncharacterized protein (DUF1697 family)
MPRYAAFLRGINVGGTRIKKDELCAPFNALGYEAVTTFRASGNLIFDAPRRGPSTLRKEIEERLAAELGFARAVTFIRTAAEMRALGEARPLEPGPGQKLHVMLLLKRPEQRVLEFATAGDQLALGAKEVFWLPRGNMSESRLDLNAIEKLVGPATLRTKGTIDEIAARWF